MPNHSKRPRKSLKTTRNISRRGNNLSRKQNGGFMVGGSGDPIPARAMSHLNGLNMEGGAKGSDRQKQNTEVFKKFATKTLVAIDIAATKITDTTEPVVIAMTDVRDLFTKITNVVRSQIHPSKALVEDAIVQDISSHSRRIYTEFMETFLMFDADPDEIVKSTKGNIWGDKSLTPEKVQKIKNRLRPAVEENIRAFVKEFVQTVKTKARELRREMRDDKDIAGAQRIAAKAVTEYTRKFKQTPELFHKRFITNLKLSIVLHPSVSLDFHVYGNPSVIKRNIARFARKYFVNMLGDFKKLGDELADPDPADKSVTADEDDENDLMRENNRLYAQFLRIMQDIQPLLTKRKKSGTTGDGVGNRIGPDGIAEPESFRESMMKGVRRITTATLIRSLQEVMKMVGDGEKPFTSPNIKGSLNTMQSKLEVLKESIHDPETMEYLEKAVDACREITEIITGELREPILEGSDKMMEIGIDASTKMMQKVSKFAKNMVRIIPVVGDIFIIAENSLTAISAGVSAVAGMAGFANQGVKSYKQLDGIINDPGANGIRNKFKDFKEFYAKFMGSLKADTPQKGVSEAINAIADAIDPPDEEEEAKKTAMKNSISNTNIGDIPDTPPPLDVAAPPVAVPSPEEKTQ